MVDDLDVVEVNNVCDVDDVVKTAGEVKFVCDEDSGDKEGTENIEEYDTELFNGSEPVKCADCSEEFKDKDD